MGDEYDDGREGGILTERSKILKSRQMTTVTFDKLAYPEMLKASGIPEPQARAHTQALDSALHDAVATRQDVVDLRRDIDFKLAEIKADILKWLSGLLLGQTAVLVALVKLL